MKSYAPKLQAKSQQNDAKAPGGSRGATPLLLAEHHPQAGRLSSLQAMVDRSPKAQQFAGLQAMADNSPHVQAQVALQRRADERQENRTGMPDQLKNGLEQLSGMDLSDVRVHRNSSKPAQLNALAYAQGRDIHLGPGQEQHLPHEGWHVVQQAQSRVRATTQAKGVAINDDPRLEREADVMGTRALHGQAAPIQNDAIQDRQALPTQRTVQCQPPPDYDDYIQQQLIQQLGTMDVQQLAAYLSGESPPPYLAIEGDIEWRNWVLNELSTRNLADMETDDLVATINAAWNATQQDDSPPFAMDWYHQARQEGVQRLTEPADRDGLLPGPRGQIESTQAYDAFPTGDLSLNW